ncbi:MAG TPA: hypothetical protein DCO77_06795 [Nitrospiraceae bacterium]|nr:hypothetical protein [Nitrospiraceae bacterium]
MKKSFIMMSIAVVVAIFFLSACGGGDDGGPPSEGSPGSEVVIAESTPHSGSVAAYSESFYTFTASSTSLYTIGVTNTWSDLSWHLFTSNTYTTEIGFCDFYLFAADEVCTINLTAGVTYYLAVVEWNYIGGYFNLTVTP